MYAATRTASSQTGAGRVWRRTYCSKASVKALFRNVYVLLSRGVGSADIQLRVNRLRVGFRRPAYQADPS